MVYRICSIAICWLIAPAVLQAQGANSSPAVRAVPLYEQCKTLVSGGDAAPKTMAALKDKDPQKRVEAARTLAKLCDKRATEALISAVRDETLAVRVASVEALGQLGDEEAIAPLVDAIPDQDWQVRWAMIRSLASFQKYPSNNAVLNLLTNPGDKKITDEHDLRVRCFGILMVNQLRDVRFSRKAISFLFVFQDHERPEFRRIAEETGLELRHTRNGYHELAGILKQHSYPEFRRKAAYWLGKFGTEEARAVLQEAAATDKDPSVQKVAQDALAKAKN